MERLLAVQDTPRLELQNVYHSFGGDAVVADLSLRLYEGEVICLLGPSGCGKSTILRIAAGVEQQNTGRVLVDGQVVSSLACHMPPERRSIGLMFQDFALFPHLNVKRNIAFGLQKSDQEKWARVFELLERVELQGYEDKFPHELSGGEQQRVALARALAPRPRIFLMDEPFSGLDDRLRDDVRDATLELLRDEGTAVLLVTHEPEEAMRMADQIALMRAGRIVQQGAPYNLYNAPKDREAAAFFSDVNVVSGVVKNALTQTPFGQFLVPGAADGVEVEIIIRPQHLRLDFDRHGKGPNPTAQEGTPAKGSVARARFLGNHSLVEFEMEYDGSRLQVTVPGVFLPEIGRVLWLSMRRDRCFVFPRT